MRSRRYYGLCLAGVFLVGLSTAWTARVARSEPASRPSRLEPGAHPGLPHGQTPGANALDTWYQLPELSERGTSGCLYDNGAPLDDSVHPASQWSTTPAPPAFQFIAAAADDFILDAAAPSGEYCRLNKVRACFAFFNDGSESATPKTTWEGVYVTIYPNSGSNTPAGEPTNTGGQSGSYIVSRFVPASSLSNETAVGACIPSFQVDIPVDIIVAKNQRYWLSLVPKFPAMPQCAWCLSQSNTGFGTQKGFPVLSIPFWTPDPGNQESCPNAPPAGSRKDLSFMLFGDDEPQTTGACCTDSNASCLEGVDAVVCQQPGQRFTVGGLCANFNPACGTTGVGGCCQPDGICGNYTPADCANRGGAWGVDLCAGPNCAPENGQCANSILLTGDSIAFDTTNAVTDGPNPGSPACPVNQDVWYRVIATCTGTMTVSLCAGTNYDAAIAVYQGWGCGLATGVLVACDDDTCAVGGPSQASFSVTLGNQYLIRVGGKGLAKGTGILRVSCAAPPANDTCANAVLITNGFTPFDTRGAKTDGPRDNPSPPCANMNQDVWFKYTASCDGTVSVSTCLGADFDTVVEVRQGWGCGGSLGPRVACDNDFCAPGGASQVSFSATTGAQFLIRVGGAGGANGTGNLFVGCVPAGQGACCHGDATCEVTPLANCSAPCDVFAADLPCELAPCQPGGPVNDQCENAVQLTNSITPFQTCRATTDGPADMIGPPCSDVERDVWFSVIAPCTGQLTASLCSGTAYDAAMAVYDGCVCPPAIGNQLGCDNDGCSPGGPAMVTVSVVQGNCYLIRIGGAGGQVGFGELTITCIDAVTSDCCPGDANGDMLVDEFDIPLFVELVLSPPPAILLPFCRADANEDGAVNAQDIAAFLDKLLLAKPCCCKGDMNGDGLLDARDIQGLIKAVLGFPAPGTFNYCHADVNQDGIIDLLDVDAFVNRLMAEDVCPLP